MVELRQYTLHPSRRDDLIELFDREFVETQEATGMHIVAQFRDLDDPDRYVWIRGFTDMTSRTSALEAFYGGPVWKQHRTAAASTMIDSDDVLLLRPAFERAGLAHPPAPRPSTTDRDVPAATIVVTIHPVAEPLPTAAVRDFAAEVDATLEAHGARSLAWYVTEPAENTFPALPVRTDVSVVVNIAAFDDVEQHRVFMAGPTPPAGDGLVAGVDPVAVAARAHRAISAALTVPARRDPVRRGVVEWRRDRSEAHDRTARATSRSFTVAPFSHDGATHDVYRKGEGPAVIVITEMPGISPMVLGFADRVVALGCSAVVPDLFGTAGRDPTAGSAFENTMYGLRSMAGRASAASSRFSPPDARHA